jgi:methylmalonyl-CoA mutase
MSDLTELCNHPQATREDWERRVVAVLKGASFETLRSSTADGIAIEPLYGTAKDQASARPAVAPWIVAQRVDHPEPGQACELAQMDARNGAAALVLTFSGAASARGFGLRDASARTIAFALNDLPLHMLGIRLEAGEKGIEAAEALREVIFARSLNPERMRVSFGMDPIGALASRGGLDEPVDAMMRRAGETARSLARDFAGPFIEADGRVFHDGGASEAQELGACLAAAVAYLRLFETTLDDEASARTVGLTLSADADIFASLAKFRAARLLWQHVSASCGLPHSRLSLHGETSWRMMTAVDSHGNLLRNVAAVFAAGAGGADSVCCLPFSLTEGLPDDFARRMARNVQLILLEEASLHLVADPAAGSGYVAALTGALCERAWTFFQDIEKRGGLIEALKGGFIQEALGKTRERRERELREGRRQIVGVTAYGPSGPAPASVLDAMAQWPSPKEAIVPLPARRDAEEAEKRRVV